MKSFDVIVVGGGISGLTACAYLSTYGYKVALIEKEPQLGGNISSFDFNGHHLDGGIRSMESSGVLKPMIRDLSLDVELIKSRVTLGIEEQVIPIQHIKDIDQYEALLKSKFPNNAQDIMRIFKKIKRILKYMDVLYGIENPMMIDLKKRPSYVIKTLIPWFFKFVPTLYQIEKLTVPVEDYLKRYTNNQALIDLIVQHFFKSTPAFFALGYFSIYFDYYYPIGGTSKLIEALEKHVIEHGGAIIKHTEVKSIEIEKRVVVDGYGQSRAYQKLIWAADLKTLYQQLDLSSIQSKQIIKKIDHKKELIATKRGAESVLSVYATVNLEKDFFRSIASEHFFYTPSAKGMSQYEVSANQNKEILFAQLKKFYEHTTYEISIPALRDERLSPVNETGLIISIIIDYDIIKHISNLGYYEAFKIFTTNAFIEILSNTIYKHLKHHVIDSFCSTPLTFEKRTGSTDGAIVGWSYQNKPIPVYHKMSKIMKSIQTPIPNVYQAGQWTFSPAGLPIAILTGKLAADRVKKKLKLSAVNINKL